MKFSKPLLYGFGLLILVGIALFVASVPEALPPLLNALLMIGLPIFLGVFIAKKYGPSWNTYAIGAATWGITFILHLAFNAWLLNPLMEILGLSASSTGLSLLWAGILLGLAAGLFEETGRYVVYARFLPKSRKWSDGLMLGAGHGGFEAIFFGGLALYGFLQMVVLKDASPDQLATMVSPESLEGLIAQVNAFWNAPWYDMVLGSIERISAMVIHLSMSLMVLNSFRKKNLLWFFASILWHTLTNATAVYSLGTWGPYVAEVLLLVIAVMSLGIIVFFQRKNPDTKEEVRNVSSPALPQISTPEKVIITNEKLDESRYE